MNSKRSTTHGKKLKVLIAGGGIGGMAAAAALLQRGFEVEVYEQAGEMREVGAGIQISPNGNRALDSLGVFAALQEKACNAQSKEIRLWNTGKTWPLFSLGDAAVRQYGYPYLTVFRPDLLVALSAQVEFLQPGAIRLGARVEQVSQDSSGTTLTLSDGSEVRGDVLIGADGIHSKVRSALFGSTGVEFSGMVAWRALIPIEQLPERFQRSVAANWVGPGGHVVHYPVQGGRLMNFVGTLEGNVWKGPPWNAQATKEACLDAFAGWHEDILTMIRSAPEVRKWALCTAPLLENWSIDRITLLGDACHATLPFLAQGAVHAIEDGVVLARALDESADIPSALRRYDAARRPRANRMVLGAAENASRFHHPDLANEQSADEFISREWQSSAINQRYSWLFEYDAQTADV